MEDIISQMNTQRIAFAVMNRTVTLQLIVMSVRALHLIIMAL